MEERIRTILEKLCEGLTEKDEAMRLALLASIAGESIFFLGLPGTAKSMVSRRLKSAFKGEDDEPLHYFEYLMNQFSTPDELFGPVSLKSLEKDEYKRIVKGYLPDADVAFLDEIWKASPAIQNTLLTIINEKLFHNGNEPVKVPLKALISASNELPAENQGLEALWDRFLIRLMVNPVQNKDAFIELVCGKIVNPEIGTLSKAISIKELEEWKQEIEEVSVPDEVKAVIREIHSRMWKLHEEQPKKNLYYISDRRWIKIVHLLKSAAFLNGRKEVDLMDCSLISYCIWNSNETIAPTKKMVEDCIIDDGISYNEELEEINNQIKAFHQFVVDNFFEQMPKMYEMKDGHMAYKLIEPKDIDSRIYYVSYSTGKVYYGACYDEDCEEIYSIINGSCKIEGDRLYWTYYSKGEIEVSVEMEVVKRRSLYGYTEASKPKEYKIGKAACAFKLVNAIELPKQIGSKAFYVSPDFEEKGAFLGKDKKPNCAADYDVVLQKVEIVGDKITVDYSYGIYGYYSKRSTTLTGKVEMLSEKSISGDADGLQSLEQQANNQYYEIKEKIASCLLKIKEDIESKEKQYGNNLFTDTSLIEIIQKTLYSLRNDFYQCQVELDKIKDKYIHNNDKNEEQES